MYTIILGYEYSSDALHDGGATHIYRCAKLYIILME